MTDEKRRGIGGKRRGCLNVCGRCVAKLELAHGLDGRGDVEGANERVWRGCRGVGAAARSVPPDPTMMGLYYAAMLPVSRRPLSPVLIFTVDSLAKETHLACTV